MHACLQIPEILQVIFANLTEVKNSSSVRPSYTTLYHLALTCRTFREPALDALWAYIQVPEVLITCLPQNVRARPVEWAAGGGVVRSIGRLVAADRATLQKYAFRVRSFTFKEDNAKHHVLHESDALSLFNSGSSPSPFFPLLQELYWYDQRDVLLPCLQRCISTTLIRLVIHLKCWSSEMVDLLAGMGKACPNIKEFRCLEPPASACTMLSDIVPCWGDLEILETGAVNAQALKHLASLKQLRELKMLVPEGYIPEPMSLFSVIFSVDTISMTVPSVQFLLAFLTPLQISAKSVQLRIKKIPNAVDLNHLIPSLAKHFKSHVLESLNVGVVRTEYFFGRAIPELTASTLRSLQAFAGLTNLDLSSMHISITDDEILDLVSAWPQMKYLHLDTNWGRGVHLEVTFLGLVGVLERCPKLRSLGMNLNTTASPSPTLLQYTGIASEQVTDLRVGYAECNDVEAIGDLLAEMCPNLNNIYSPRSENTRWHDQDISTRHLWFEGLQTWKKVEGFIVQRRKEQLTQQWVYTHRF
ncbi:hypothetical protein CY34DRAFT_812243 [Suillus luteus UH-Slu-Lm8-n1]|uniref:F-box domain-containing protein n=1 Tax=Suillus luteus UH-Slu-Lm8-n1 TaxID=930992 RepID=A0A0D0A0K0_9AGAM|nr:hypothetical protein CY34DRAFT_812243 [Suillus luteus UH-Slu-Lm8-n1]